MKTLKGLLILTLAAVGLHAIEEPYKFEKPLSVTEFFKRNGRIHEPEVQQDFNEDQMAVESTKSKRQEKVEETEKLRKRRIEIRPRKSTTKPKELPTFPNFPQIFEQVNDNLQLNNDSQTISEMLPIPEPLTMSKSASRPKKVNSMRRKVDTLPVNLTPPQSEAYRKTPYDYDDYYEDYYYDDYYYDELLDEKQPFQPLLPVSPKKPYQEKKPIRKSPPKSSSFSKWAKGDKITRLIPPKMSKLPPKKAMNHPFRKRLQNHRLQVQDPLKNVKADRFAPLPQSQSSVLETLPSKTKKKKVIEYEYYDDYDYYDDFYVPAKPRRRQYGGGGGGVNPLALLVAPLAAISLLAAAAAVAINPVLINVSLTGRRKKRSSPELDEKMHELQVLEKFLGSIPENNRYQQQILSMYLTCSGYTEPQNKCLDRVVCDYSNDKSNIKDEEKDVISIILYNIMANEYVTEDYKDRLRSAARAGRDDGTCQKVYTCSELDAINTTF